MAVFSSDYWFSLADPQSSEGLDKCINSRFGIRRDEDTGASVAREDRHHQTRLYICCSREFKYVLAGTDEFDHIRRMAI